MRITFFGAAKEVTGSCHLLETEKARLLVDCGLFQGNRRLERLNLIPRKLAPRTLDCVLLTHGHLDHCGRLPLLGKAGFNGPIYATQGTIEIATLILKDAAHVQENDIKRENRRRQRAGQKAISPLFDLRDVQHILSQFKSVDYDEWFDPLPGVSVRYVEAGHILGSASIEIDAGTGSKRKRLIFSGDLGPYDVPIMKDPARIDRADFVFMESTYGDRDHRSLEASIAEFRELIDECTKKGGKVLIPVFAVGRTQQVLYHLAELFREGKLKPIPIYLDSPMAIQATAIYQKHPELQDREARDLANSGQLRKDLSSLRLCESAPESMLLNETPGPCIIMAGAGMCNAGRILHHLKHNLWLESTTVIIVGYQARGSLGRMLVDGADTVKIMGETIAVKAKVRGVGGFSAHADQSDLIRWLSSMTSTNPKVTLIHGEPHPMSQLAYRIENDFGLKCSMPSIGSTAELTRS